LNLSLGGENAYEMLVRKLGELLLVKWSWKVNIEMCLMEIGFNVDWVTLISSKTR